jgi:polyhydroxybutyrate depolymerase
MTAKLRALMLASVPMLISAFTAPVDVRAAPEGVTDQSHAIAIGWHRLSIEVDGLERWFRVFVPSRNMAGAPVILLLHGGGRSMDKIFSKRAGAAREWPELAKRQQFLLLAPNGINPLTGNPGGEMQQWNSVRDVSFLLRLLEWAHAKFQTDSKRVYVTGASNGGMMTYKMLIDHPEVFAAGAAFLANLTDELAQDSRLARPVPIMIVNGTKDPLVNYNGQRLWLGHGRSLSATETVSWWVEANGSRAGKVTASILPDVDKKDGCRIRVNRFHAPTSSAAPVYLYTMIGGGHAMPSRKHAIDDRWIIRWVIGPRCRDAEAAELAWDFFRKFTR